jgi:hypothetical protein
MNETDAPRPPGVPKERVPWGTPPAAEGEVAESIGLYQECTHYAAAKGVRPTARSAWVFDHCPDCLPPWSAPPITAAERAALDRLENEVAIYADGAALEGLADDLVRDLALVLPLARRAGAAATPREGGAEEADRE